MRIMPGQSTESVFPSYNLARSFCMHTVLGFVGTHTHRLSSEFHSWFSSTYIALVCIQTNKQTNRSETIVCVDTLKVCRISTGITEQSRAEYQHLCGWCNGNAVCIFSHSKKEGTSKLCQGARCLVGFSFSLAPLDKEFFVHSSL